MCLPDELPERDEVFSERLPARPQRRRFQPVTWVVTVALTPVLLFDVWQTVQDVQYRHAAAGYENISSH